MNRSINWLDQVTRAIKARHRETAGCAEYIAQRLTNLLLERLPAEMAERTLALLPEMERDYLDLLSLSAAGPGDGSIGYGQFVDRAAFAIGCSGAISCPDDRDQFETELQRMAKQVTDTFLWAIAHEFPVELKVDLATSLPFDLRSRMDLYGQTQSRAA